MRIIPERATRYDPEIVVARGRNVDPHLMPDIVPLSRVAGGVSSAGRRAWVTVKRMQCQGGTPKNVEYCGAGSGIIGECGSCGTNIYWESRLKIWTAQQT